MAAAYSDDLREKVMKAYGRGGATIKALSERFEVSYGWVRKVAASERSTGSFKRVAQRRAASRFDPALVRRLVAAQPDAVLSELRERMRVEAVTISSSHLWWVLRQAGIRLKKSRSTPPSATRKKTSAAVKRSSKSSVRTRPKT
jgi:transposase